ncbi:thymidine phosphorylase [Methylobacterium gregans]|uniref:Thymidine phosphorylase n=1 Tax=Methylobacterium gregans TaxID=374424 RepID=A0AA37MFS5_9HYPH|nr:thymidine phosphorylase [Methylobacterium gregans]MDQ0522650.1 thymidine phosphorylase [Methylobacterium gregans]GJD81333.1 Thymidine phosphorylase [Methylobacterium gregans]GLS56828.1 thymidine phosphorylase [Methylobacterium gregans]
MRLPQETIRRKRDGLGLDATEIADFVAGLTEGRVTEGQAAAFCMAVFFRGLTLPERVALTRAMTESGTVLAWDLPGPVLDKHSTGGIGDTVSLPLAAMVAACGGYVPMISGRGLGHTGGTLDKLASIPGYDAVPGLARFQAVVRAVGCAIIGQTAELAPADRRLYAIRDVTGTVESLDLITASILSKKLAAGLDGLVMDVKVGSGAFMAGMPEARALAESIVGVATGAGLRTVALVTDMDAPLASAAGNAVEVAYAIDYLAGRRREARFHAVTLALGAEMLVAGGLAAETSKASDRLEDALGSGRAAELFGRMVAALGGPADLLERPAKHLPAAPVVRAVRRDGPVSGIATREIGLAVIGLGGGRTRPEDGIDPRVGFTDLARPGEAGDLLGVVHAADADAADRAEAALRAAYRSGEAAPEGAAVLERIG